LALSFFRIPLHIFSHSSKLSSSPSVIRYLITSGRAR
jgi:hypothetical protein